MRTLATSFLNIYGAQKVNSLTKFPSILNFHAPDDKAMLTENITTLMPENDLVISEKIHGTNVRLIAFSDGSVIVGSREQLLHETTDTFWNTDLDIVSCMYELDLLTKLKSEQGIVVIYGELYGGTINNKHAKNYTDTGAHGFRMFDAFEITDFEELTDLAAGPIGHITRWREKIDEDGHIIYGQPFMGQDELGHLSRIFGFELSPVLPVTSLPKDQILQGMQTWLTKTLPKSLAKMSQEALGKPEGVVISTNRREKRVKVRFEDYQRTLLAAATKEKTK